MDFQVFAASAIDGFMIGFIYGLAAMGLTLIWGVMRVINLAHGATMALGMFAVYLLSTRAGVNPYIGLIAVVVAGLVFGIAMYFIAVHRIINAPELMTLLSTFAVDLVIIGVATATFTTSPRALDVELGAFRAGDVTILGTEGISVLIAILITATLYVFLYRTRMGGSIRAVANNRVGAELMGINTTQMLAFSFGLGIMLAAASGALIATLFPFTILSGSDYELKSFVIVVLGSLGNPTGALAGGIVLGLLEGVSAIFMPQGWVPIIEYGAFVLLLLVRPNGFLGARV